MGENANGSACLVRQWRSLVFWGRGLSRKQAEGVQDTSRNLGVLRTQERDSRVSLFGRFEMFQILPQGRIIELVEKSGEQTVVLYWRISSIS